MASSGTPVNSALPDACGSATIVVPCTMRFPSRRASARVSPRGQRSPRRHSHARCGRPPRFRWCERRCGSTPPSRPAVAIPMRAHLALLHHPASGGRWDRRVARQRLADGFGHNVDRNERNKRHRRRQRSEARVLTGVLLRQRTVGSVLTTCGQPTVQPPPGRSQHFSHRVGCSQASSRL